MVPVLRPLRGSYIASRQPSRVPDLMAYQALIAKASQSYCWPSWLVYDQSFRQEVAEKTTQSWAKVDPSLYALCFFGQNRSAENWCAVCQAMDHTTATCPTRLARKWSWVAGGSPQQAGCPLDVCLKYNRFNGDCKFGSSCRFQHVCSNCGERHPATKCPKSGGDKRARVEPGERHI